MAVPKRKTSVTRRNRRRAFNFKVNKPQTVVCKNCGKLKKPHIICPNCGQK